MRERLLDQADRAVGAVIAAARWLVLPVSLLLFLQWPLRDLLHAWSREANDLAQWLFALYVSVALTDATRAGAALCLLPWSLFVLVAGAPTLWRSVRGLEQFPETYNPGYFIIKGSVCL